MKKFIAVMIAAIAKLWAFSAKIITISLIAFLVLFGLALFMPDNEAKAVEVVKSIIG